MSRRRRSSIRQNNRKLAGKRGPHGWRLCRFCETEVKPPRRTFCSDECVHEWKLRSDAKYLRVHVYERDLGKCAICGVDTRLQKIEVEDAIHEAKKRAGQNWQKHLPLMALLKRLCITVGEAKKSLWQADHVIPVVMGGGECGMGNIRTLCLACHKAQTRKLAKSRSNKSSL